MAYFQYAVKYLCGAGDGINLARNPYLTAINIHNPFDFPQDPIWLESRRKPAARRRSTPSGAAAGAMATNQPTSRHGNGNHCRHISQHGGGIPTGFVVIRSPNELDVVAVYTVERANQPADILQILNITPRIIQTDQPMCPG